MKVTIDFDDEVIQPAIQLHLVSGISVQRYIEGAVKYFSMMLNVEASGKKCGYGDATRFNTYNNEVSPKTYL